MKTELFDLVNRNYKAVRYLDKNRKEEREQAIVLLISMVGVAIALITLCYLLLDKGGY